MKAMKTLLESRGLPKIVLYGSNPCPFVHRVQIALDHTNTPYEFVEIKLENKKHVEFLNDISPYGKILNQHL